MLTSAEAVRDAGWWQRTVAYWFVLLLGSPLLTGDATGRVGTLLGWLATAALGFGIWHRDRYPLVVVGAALVAGVFVAEVPVAVGVAVLASRARPAVTLIASALGALVLLAPMPRLVASGVTLTQGVAPNVAPVTGWVRGLIVGIGLVVLPAMAGAIRRANRATGLQRLAFEAGQRELVADRAAGEERGRIAQEMHDVLGHKLSLITMQAGALSVNPAAGPEVVERQAELIRTTSRQALDELRGILGVLGRADADPLHPPPGLAETRALLTQSVASGLRLEVVDDLGDPALPSATGAALHRVVSEALTNASRHAPGAAIRVRLDRRTPGSLRVEIANERARERPAGPGTGRGLPGLRARVQAVGGTLAAGPAAGGGYRLVAELPLAAAGSPDAGRARVEDRR